jgi:hypothetical protein
MVRRRGYFLPVLLIGVGVIALLVNLDFVSRQALSRLADLWPLVLIIIGVQIILNYSLPRRQANLVGVVVMVLLVAAAVAYATIAPVNSDGVIKQADSSAPIQGLTSATLEIQFGATSVEVSAAQLGDQLYHAHFEYAANERPPDLSFDRPSGTLRIRAHNDFFAHLLTRERKVAVQLSDQVPWKLHFSGGANTVRLDLSQLQLARLDLSGGAGHLELDLPQPKGTVPIDISGGVSGVIIRAPKDSAWRFHLSGGAPSLDINGSHRSAVGSYSQESPNFGSAENRYEIQLSGGFSDVRFETGPRVAAA